MSFCYTRTISYSHIQGQQSYNVQGKENTEEEEEVKGTYILLSGILAVVVTSAAVRGTTRFSIAVVHVRCSLYPNTHPLSYGYSLTTLHLYRCQNVVLFLFSCRMISARHDHLILSECCLLLLQDGHQP